MSQTPEERWPHLSPEEREMMLTAPSFQRVFREGFEEGKAEALAKRARKPLMRDRFLIWLLSHFERY